ncbi:tRNA pseudouridine synthase A [Alienimonas californiensis]|uniref:tRNA pseudouridine synthase A n=1 Tax=Alienimonas californiensis TaxID=2527989 RepID=A0A517P9C1_9PLAN|nr:tRNA pseudouridine synthase A [Alienimonas californiensis]
MRLRVSYDGTDFFGWQVQPGTRTVQGELQEAIFRLTGERRTVVAAGRTDAGVHALGQACHFRTQTPTPAHRLGPALAPHLPPDVAVLEGRDVPPHFHSTRDAVSKTYRYVILNDRDPNPLARRFAWRVRPDVRGNGLNVDAMREAAAHIVGRHDFACFQSAGSPRPDTVRTVHRLTLTRAAIWPAWSPVPGEEIANDAGGPWLFLEVTGDGFLYNMVRTIAGTLAEVGMGKRPPEDVAALIASRDRTLAGPTAPPQGLYLVRVDYDD